MRAKFKLVKEKVDRKTRIGILLLLLFLSGAIMLTFKGHDAVTHAQEQKGSILTAEQIHLAFQGVGGRIVNILVQEEQAVKKGDILMLLDPTDTELEIAKLEATIAQLDAQIRQQEAGIRIGYQKVDTAEQKTYIDIQKQKLAVQAAVVSYEDAKRSYDRMKSLYEIGAVAKSNFDSASAAFELAKSSMGQQEQALNRMLEGATAGQKQLVIQGKEVRDVYLPEIDQSRQELANSALTTEQLQKQKEAYLVQLKALQVQKERLMLRAPEDGRIIKVIPKTGENVALNAPVLLLETDRFYYDLYVDEVRAATLQSGDKITGKVVALKQTLAGQVRFVTAAPGFASLRMSREKGQADLASFQVRIYVPRQKGLLPGMTIEVDTNEFLTR